MVTGPKGHGGEPGPWGQLHHTRLPQVSELMFSLMASVRLSTGGRGLYDAQWEDAKLSTHVNILTAAAPATSQCTKSRQACWSEQRRPRHTHTHTHSKRHSELTQRPQNSPEQQICKVMDVLWKLSWAKKKKIGFQCSRFSWIRNSFHLNSKAVLFIYLFKIRWRSYCTWPKFISCILVEFSETSSTKI